MGTYDDMPRKNTLISMNSICFTHCVPPLIPPVWLKGGHFQTIYAKTICPPIPQYRRELIADSYGKDVAAYDFLDSDDPNAPLLVIFHGLEGSSQSHYAVELMNNAQKRKWHGVVAHFRSCGGVDAKRAYHSGDTHEITHMLSILSKRYTHIYAVGISLGGNTLAKYLGEQKDNAIPIASVIVSAPIDLSASSAHLEHGLSHLLYTQYFLRTLYKKVPQPPKKCHSLGEFDDRYTAPINGFTNKEEFYQKSAAKPFLPYITRPTLLLNALNDPFIPAYSLPKHSEISLSTYLLQPQHGGHCGFVSGTGKGHLHWLSNTVFTFFEKTT